ncbi:814_t:CDS:2 [Racocetra fulgida]|uniref:814_t:CDS:1 n=1 Tax=Racocetra fulgida TaxID=60492 RepID=A0A9N8VCD8_9GLOM|nr:814_t:CDS:2 [Racocetra fulgida]
MEIEKVKKIRVEYTDGKKYPDDYDPNPEEDEELHNYKECGSD